METIVEKVKKLLALSTSTNINEAKLALAKARELMAKYNVTITDESKKIVIEKQIVVTTKGVSVYVKTLVSTLINFYGVKALLRNSGSQTNLFIVGTTTDVECFTQIYSYVLNIFNKEYKTYRDSINTDSRSDSLSLKWSFFCGFVKGLVDELESQKYKEALVVVVPEEVDAYIKNKHVKSHSFSSGVSIKENYYLDGRDAGKDAIRFKDKRI